MGKATTDDRLTEIEIKLSYQERTVETLNDVIIDQGKQIAALRLQLQQLLARVEPEGE